METQNDIQATGVTRTFGPVRAVDNLSLSVGAGEIYGLMGPDGAGKTTTIRLLCGALGMDAGKVELGGIDLTAEPEKAKEMLGYLPQGSSLYGDLTVRENLQFFAEARGLHADEWAARSQEILEFVDLAQFSDRKCEDLSGGMKKKLGLAIALIHRPRIMLLDEPTGGVDPVTRQAFWQLLIRLLKDGVAVLISTPYMDEASRCNRVGFMNQGRILIEGKPGDIVRGLANRILEVAGGPRNALRGMIEELPGVEDVQTFGDRLHVRISRGSATKFKQALGEEVEDSEVVVSSIREIPPSLEDVFIELLQRENASHA